VEPCYINDCNCLYDEIVCEVTDQPAPRFTFDERFVVRYLYISVSQLSWISRSCGLFPRLQEVIMMDGSQCPLSSCVHCR
jgi:hypothetical protein